MKKQKNFEFQTTIQDFVRVKFYIKHLVLCNMERVGMKRKVNIFNFAHGNDQDLIMICNAAISGSYCVHLSHPTICFVQLPAD